MEWPSDGGRAEKSSLVRLQGQDKYRGGGDGWRGLFGQRWGDWNRIGVTSVGAGDRGRYGV